MQDDGVPTVGTTVLRSSEGYVFPGITIAARGETSSAAMRRNGLNAEGRNGPQRHTSNLQRGQVQVDNVAPDGGNRRGVVNGSGNVSRRMATNLRLHVGMVRTIVKAEMGDKFPGKAGLKQEEPLGSNVVAFWDKMLSGTTRERNKKWFKHLVPYLIVLSGEDFINEFGPDGQLTSVGWTAVSWMLNYKEGRMYGSWQIRWRHIFDL